MNNSNNIFKQNEIENKLKDFQEGKDYSVSPTDEPNIKTYNFHNDKLRSVFRNDRVPVRITQEAYDGKDYTYRGHFEEGKDYSYSRQDWQFGENYQGNRGTDVFGEGEFKNLMDGIKWDEHYRENTPNRLTFGWKYRGKGNLNGNNEPKQIENGFNSDFFGGERGLVYPSCNNPKHSHAPYWKTFREEKKDLEDKLNHLKDKYGYDLVDKSIAEKIDCIKIQISDLERQIEEEEAGIHPLQQKGWVGRNTKGSWVTGERDGNTGNNNFNLQKENQELRKELSEVKNQLVQVLDELKKLKNNSTGQDSEKLNQQIVQNEKLIKEGGNISVSEVQEQVNKSQALLKEAAVSATVSPTKSKDNGNGSLPYLIGGSALLASVGIIGYCLVKKNRGKKVV